MHAARRGMLIKAMLACITNDGLLWPLNKKKRADSQRYQLGMALSEGIEHRQIEGVRVREAWRSRRASSKNLWKYAEICRVANVMRPYLESLT